ncbi:hypothetical protein [Sphingobium aquiterrae]|uniref:hypothetical protein n=1 Tax=Sphingobium aquiterrae TaxID=2038656 RepID=UPI003018725A
MKTTLKFLGLASLALVAACDSKKENAVENAYENQAGNLENQADNLDDAADNLTGNAASAMENAADMVENKAAAMRAAGDTAADAAEDAQKKE